jgi:hypothetical protein
VALRPQPAPAEQTRKVGLRERTRLRRRVRFLRKRRELELRDLGGLIFDMYRFGSKRQDLVRDKLQEMFADDRELREFEHLVGRRQRRLDIREAGIGGACPRCGQLFSTEARFCSRCGQNVSDGARPDVIVEPQTMPAPAAAPYRPEPEPRVHRPEPEPETRAWPEPEPQTWQEPVHTAAWHDAHAEPEPEPAVHHTPAWQDAHAQPEPEPVHHTPAWQGAQPRPGPAEPQETGGRRGPFRRRRRKTPQPGAHAGDEAQRQVADWEAQYQASVQAQRRAWQAESQRRQSVGSGEGGDPLASRPGDPRR